MTSSFMHLVKAMHALLLACFLFGFATSTFAADSIAVRDLPPEAQQTLTLIRQGGPFPYSKDGVVFGNYEHALPEQRRGYYHEYTVKTPGVRSRGAQRIIVGGDAEYLYQRPLFNLQADPRVSHAPGHIANIIPHTIKRSTHDQRT